MPSDANGVYSLPDGYLAVTGAPIQASQHNPPLEDLGNAMTGRLPRTGVAAMTGPLRVPDGTVDAPTLAFASDPSAGFYLSAGKIIPTKPLSGVLPIGLGPLPWSRMTAPAGWVLCYGQTLNRVTYADLWVVAQAEIAAGNPMYNNGDGSLTFGILDMRGRVTSGWDSIGGVAAGRLTGTFGAGIGLETQTLLISQIPSHFHDAFIGDPGHDHTGSYTAYQPSGGGVGITTGGLAQAVTNTTTGFTTSTNTTGVYVHDGNGISGATKTGLKGGSGSHPNVQPTLVTNAILYAGA